MIDTLRFDPRNTVNPVISRRVYLTLVRECVHERLVRSVDEEGVLPEFAPQRVVSGCGDRETDFQTDCAMC